MTKQSARSTVSGLVGRIDAFVGLVGRAVSWLTLGLVLLVALNVLARYLFSMGTVALQELEWHVLAVTALVGISFGVNRGGEVRVDMLYARFGPRTRAGVDMLAGILMLLVALYLAYVSIAYVNQSFRFNEGSPDPGGLPYRFVLKSFIPIGMSLLALQSVVEIAKAAARLNDASS